MWHSDKKVWRPLVYCIKITYWSYLCIISVFFCFCLTQWFFSYMSLQQITFQAKAVVWSGIVSWTNILADFFIVWRLLKVDFNYTVFHHRLIACADYWLVFEKKSWDGFLDSEYCIMTFVQYHTQFSNTCLLTTNNNKCQFRNRITDVQSLFLWRFPRFYEQAWAQQFWRSVSILWMISSFPLTWPPINALILPSRKSAFFANLEKRTQTFNPPSQRTVGGLVKKLAIVNTLPIERKEPLHSQESDTTINCEHFLKTAHCNCFMHLQGFFDNLSAISSVPIDPVVVIIFIAVVMFVLCFSGCVGSLRENITLLKFVSISLLTVGVAFVILYITCKW